VVTGKSAPISAEFFVIMGLLSLVTTPLLAALLKKPKEPEDWLLWDKEEKVRGRPSH
jgi:hypothetical protein